MLFSIAGFAFALTCVSQLALPVLKAAMRAWQFNALDAVIGLILIGICAIISIFASWSAVWIALGTGRWFMRLGLVLAIFHVAFSLGFSLVFIVEELRDAGSWDLEWRGPLAAFTGGSYAFSAQLLVSMFFVWLLKLFRFRLLYFDDAKSYPHPRRAGHNIPIVDRAHTIVLSVRVYLADIFALTTLFAFYLAAWYPLERALEDDQMFGAPFLFIILLAALSFNAAIGLGVVLLPLIITMLDRRGKTFQVIVHAIIFLIACITIAVVFLLQIIDSDALWACGAGIICFVAYETLLWVVMRKPTQWFRFRLVRMTK